MHKVRFSPAHFGGSVSIPPSKSFSHRALICAALAGGGCTVRNISDSKDMEATENFMKGIGVDAVRTAGENSWDLMLCQRNEDIPPKAVIDCIESGSTLRFAIPIMAALGIETEFIGEGRLPLRPISIYSSLLPEHGTKMEGQGLPCRIKGKLKSGDYRVPGNISSQFISGLMFALPLLEGDSRIILTTELESESYLNITISVLKDFGIEIIRTEYGYSVKGNQRYIKRDYTVEGDWSQAAFFMNIGALSSGEVKVRGLAENSVQGDRKCIDIYKRLGVMSRFEGDALVVWNPKAAEPHYGLRGCEVSVKDIPDMVPALAVLMSLAKGKSIIKDAERLRIKESDRLEAVTRLINSIGGNVTEKQDALEIEGVSSFVGGEAEGFGDHRILMAAATAAAASKGDIIVTDALSINKSYPDFYRDYNSIGGEAHVFHVGQEN